MLINLIDCVLRHIKKFVSIDIEIHPVLNAKNIPSNGQVMFIGNSSALEGFACSALHLPSQVKVRLFPQETLDGYE